MSKPVVLITNATSRNGSDAAKLLLANGKHTVRLGARDPSKLADFVAKGAEAVAIDPRSAESTAQACAGVEIVYLMVPVFVGDTDTVMVRNFLQAAKAAGSSIKHIVYLSAVDADNAAQPGFVPAHHHHEHEQMLKSSGVSFTSVRPAWFHENQVLYLSQSIRSTGEFRSSTGDGLWTSVAICDIAAAAVAVVSNPHLHVGKIYTLTTEAVTDKIVAEMISKVAGQKVSHVNMTPEEHKDLIVKSFSGQMPAQDLEDYANGLVSLDAQKRSNLFSTVHPDLEKLIGRKGVSLEAFLAEHADAFKRERN